jgi:hypothetical protein
MATDTTTLIAALGIWWNDVHHPRTLTIVASEQHFAGQDLESVITATQQRSVNPIPIEQDASAALGKMILLPLVQC